MPMINKIASGKLFEDNFDNATLNPAWQPSPSDPTRYSVNTDRAGYLRMKHGGTPLYLFMDMPNRDFMLELKNDYQPGVDQDSGGIIIYRDAQSRMELLEYFDALAQTSINYTHMRVSRKQNLFTGYGSKDGGQTWEVIGAGVADDMTKVGLVINYDAAVGRNNMDIDYVKVFGDTRFQVGNLTPGMQVKLMNASDVTLATATCAANRDYVDFDVTNLPVPLSAKLQLLQGSTIIETTPLQEIWGGDVFWYGLLVELYYEGNRMNTGVETQLGYMVNGSIENRLKLKNPGTDPIANIKVKKRPFFDYPGGEWVLVAEDVGGTPGTYGTEVEFDFLNAGEERYFWVRVKKELSTIPLFGDRKFLLQVTN